MAHDLIATCLIIAFGLIISSSAQSYVNIPTATDSYNINYYIEDDLITFEVTAETLGYVGFGFTNGTGMEDSDIFIGGVNADGTTYFGDYTGFAQGTPRLDTEQNWNLIQAIETSSGTFIKFSRLLSTGDLEDIIIEDKLQTILWSVGMVDPLSYHGRTSRSTLSFNLISQTNGGIDPIPPPTLAPTTQSTTPSPGTFINIPTATEDYDLNYFIEDDTITFDVIAKTKGYVGFGFTNISGMVQSDIFVAGCNDDGTTYFGDYTGISTAAPVIDSEQNWNLIEASESETHTHIVFSRLLSTGDLADIIIEDKLMNVIWSMGSTDRLAYHGFTRSTLSYNLITQTSGGANPPPTPPTSATLATLM